jgi:hypothetical protein
MSSKFADVILLGDSDIQSRIIGKMCSNHSARFLEIKNLSDYLEDSPRGGMVIIDSNIFSENLSAAEAVQAVRQINNFCFLVTILSEDVTKDQAIFLKKSGVNMIIKSNELECISTISFAIDCSLNSCYAPFYSLVDNSPSRPEFSLFYFSTEQNLYVNSPPKTANLQGYFHRSQARLYKKYLNLIEIESEKKLPARCQANFLSVQNSFINFLSYIYDASQSTSYGEAQEILSDYRNECAELLESLISTPNFWELISALSVGETNTLLRAPTVAAYTGIFALHFGLDKIPELMMASLISDIGLLSMPPEITHKIRRREPLDLLEQKELEKVPQLSFDKMLLKKISIDNKSREIILSTHERADGTGYPRGIRGGNLSIESQLIRFAREFVDKNVPLFGETIPDPKLTIRSLILDAKPGTIYTESFLSLLSKNLIRPEVFG